MTTNENGDASASEGAEARKTTRTRKRWTQRAAYLSSVSNAMVAVVARAPPLPRDSRACNDSLGKSAPRVRCERRVRGPVTAPNAPSARPLRASPRVSSSARAALPRPQARPRVPRATRPPTRLTSKKTPRRVEIRPRRKKHNVSLGTVDKPKIASGFERERRFIGKIRNVPPFAEQRSAFEAHERWNRFDQNRGAGGSPRGETHPARVRVYSQKSELKNVRCRRTLVETRVSVVERRVRDRRTRD